MSHVFALQRLSQRDWLGISPRLNIGRKFAFRRTRALNEEIEALPLRSPQWRSPPRAGRRRGGRGRAGGEEDGVDFGVDDRGGFPNSVGDRDVEEVIVVEARVMGTVLGPLQDRLHRLGAEEDEERFDGQRRVFQGAQDDELGGADSGARRCGQGRFRADSGAGVRRRGRRARAFSWRCRFRQQGLAAVVSSSDGLERVCKVEVADELVAGRVGGVEHLAHGAEVAPQRPARKGGEHVEVALFGRGPILGINASGSEGVQQRVACR